MKLAELEVKRKSLLDKLKSQDSLISEYYKEHGRTKLYWHHLRDKLDLLSKLKKVSKEIELIKLESSSFRFGGFLFFVILFSWFI